MVGIEPVICDSTDEYNKYHTMIMVQDLLDQNLSEYVFEDVAYKENCKVDIIEESQKLVMAKIIAKKGLKVTIKDRKGIVDLVQRTFGSIFDYEIV